MILVEGLVKKHPLITAIVVFAVVFALIWIASHPAPKTPLLGERNGSTTRSLALSKST
jgi:hypothetical protein